MVDKIEIIRLIQDIFSDEEELNNFLKHIEYNNDKEKADNLKENLYKLLNYKSRTCVRFIKL